MPRSMHEKITDELLLLYMLDVAERLGIRIHEETRLQKLVFLAEREMLGRRYKGFNYNFIRLDYGPYSRDLRKDLETLLRAGVIKDDDARGFILTDKGRELLRRLSKFFERNSDVLHIILKVLNEYGRLPLDQLLKEVYDLPRPLKGPEVKIRDVKMRTPLLRRLKEERAEAVIDLRHGEFKLARILLDPDVEEVRFREVMGYQVILFRYRGDEGFTVVVPDLPGCISEGDDEEDALNNIREAIELYLEVE